MVFRKRIRNSAIALFLAVALCACKGESTISSGGLSAETPEVPGEAAEEKTLEEAPATFWIVSDLHYISPELTDNGKAFTEMAENGDGKALLAMEEIAGTLGDMVLGERPETVIFCGDLTFNGAEKSHADLRKQFARMEEAGVRVLCIPGNHDLGQYRDGIFSGDKVRFVDTLTPASFRTDYASYAWAEEPDAASDSFSYVFRLRKDLWLLFVDCNSGEDTGVSEETLRFVENVLKEARGEGAEVVSVSHQTILPHHPLFSYGYQMENADGLQALYEEYGVRLNLCGHMHIQHTATKGDFTEIVTGAVSTAPLEVGVLTVDGNRWQYDTRPLPNAELQSYAAEFFHTTGKKKAMEGLLKEGIKEEEAETMAEAFATLNDAYFAGKKPDLSELSDGIALWEEKGTGFLSAYVRSLYDGSAYGLEAREGTF